MKISNAGSSIHYTSNNKDVLTLVVVFYLSLVCFPTEVMPFIVPQPIGLSQDRIFELARKRFQQQEQIIVDNDTYNNGVKNKFPMDGRVVVITGAAGGIGRELCKVVYSLGATVVGLDRDTNGLNMLQESLLQENEENLHENDGDDDDNSKRFLSFTAHHEDLNSVSSVADEIKSRFPKIDVLVNNAGFGYPQELKPGSPQMISAHGKDLAMTVNYLSHFLLTEKLFECLSNVDSANGEEGTSSSTGGRIVHLTSTFHWKVDGSELIRLPDGSDPIAIRSNPKEQHPKHVERSYANTKLAQIWHSRSIALHHTMSSESKSNKGSVSSVCACPTWAATGIAGEAGKEFLDTYAFPVRNCGPGITSAINAILCTDSELGDAMDNGQSFVANSRIVEYLGGITSWLTSDISNKLGLRDILANILAVVLLIGQRYTYDDFIIQKTSPESFNDEKRRRELYQWSLKEVEPWL